ncbi:MAG: RimK-like ATPgrasp N-terminal domain-containing protein [Gemmatimonadetes bacterium]|nr:RimK-like ATPgrasp N-terminal domain-containing protein [Gemmatimonadota bacterium]
MSRRRVVVVVSERRAIPGLPAEMVVTADEYLEGGEALSDRRLTVVNLCNSYRYRTKGYYVSLLADARGQAVVPGVETIEGLSDAYGLFRALHEAGVPTVDVQEMRARRRALPAAISPEADDRDSPAHDPAAPLLRVSGRNGLSYRPATGAEVEETLAYFGTSADPRFRAASLAVYREWPTPVLRIQWVLEEDEWKVTQVSPVSPGRLGAEERARLGEAARNERLVLRRGAAPPSTGKRASIAVLVEEGDPFSPSSPETIDKLERVAARMNVYVHRIGLDDLDKLGEYDALFIRALTGVSTPAFQFALRAEALDMPVVDDSQSIIRCSNKVFLEELLRRECIATPRTLVVTSRTPPEQVAELGFPFVLKLPDGSFSAAVHRVSSPGEYRERAGEMFRSSPLLIAQEYLPTDFDWRVTVLGGELLFAARYYMARGHWQIRSAEKGTERYGRVEAVARDQAPRPVVELALRAAALIGNGLYGVDIKETPAGPVVIEINDNPNLDIGYEDAADGNAVYEDVLRFFLRRVEEGGEVAKPERSEPEMAPLRAPIRSRGTGAGGGRSHYRPFEVAGVELEYAVVDRDLNIAHRVEDAFRELAGRRTSDVDLGAVALSNEIADHVFEVKTQLPPRSLVEAEAVLWEGIQRFTAVLRDRFDARLMPTGMHPWMDPAKARLWTRSNARTYATYARLFDVKSHGWMNVQSNHLSLPMGREAEAVAMLNAAALLVPYLPALAASSPMYDGELQSAADGRLARILEHQARIPESQGEIVPEYVESMADYRKRILGPMYAALDRFPDTAPIRHEFFNARGAVFKASSKRMEVRVLDTQECVKMDMAVAVFVRSALKGVTQRVMAGKTALPPHGVLVSDFRAAVRDGSRARVLAPHLSTVERDGEGRADVREVLRVLLDEARRNVRRDEADHLELAARVIETGTLSERIRAELDPYAEADDETFTDAARRIYIELMDCLEANEPWSRRGL